MRRLRLPFSAPADLAAEFARNIANGGAQVRAEESFELREVVEIAFEFGWRDDGVVFEAEVVFFSPDGTVAVQFAKSAAELRAELAPFLPGKSAAKPPAGRARARASLPPADAFDADDQLDLDPSALDLDALSEPEPAPASSVDPRAKTATKLPRRAAVERRIVDPLDGMADRRKSPRAVVRVPARVQAANVGFEGRTRDLSETGVLVSGDGSDLPLGKPVKLELQHPVSGRRIEARGVVARHLESEGAVAAVGISFEAREDEQRELREFVSEARRIEAERAAGGISGRIEELGMANLLQMLGQSSPRGTLTATRGNEEATVAFEGAQIRYAQLGTLSGIKALARMLQWPDGDFAFHAQVDGITDEPDPIPLQSALIEAARQVDEAARSEPLEPRAAFAVNRAAFASAGELTKIEEAVLDLAAAGLTVRRILDVIPDSDAAVQNAIRSLLDRELLTKKA